MIDPNGQGRSKQIPNPKRMLRLSAQKRNLLPLLLVVPAVAVSLGWVSSSRPPQQESTPRPLSELSVTRVKLGMSQSAVEDMLGAGEADAPREYHYGGTWTETNPFDVRRHALSVSYDEDGFVVEVVGRSLELNGRPLKPEGPDHVLGKYGKTDHVGVAVTTEASRDNAVMLEYAKAGVGVEYYDEHRMWFRLHRPYTN